MTTSCAVCGQRFRNAQGLGGHLRHSKDPSHQAARGNAPAKATLKGARPSAPRPVPREPPPRPSTLTVPRTPAQSATNVNPSNGWALLAEALKPYREAQAKALREQARHYRREVESVPAVSLNRARSNPVVERTAAWTLPIERPPQTLVPAPRPPARPLPAPARHPPNPESQAIQRPPSGEKVPVTGTVAGGGDNRVPAAQAASVVATPLVMLANQPVPEYLSKTDRVIRWVLIAAIGGLVVYLVYRLVKAGQESRESSQAWPGVFAGSFPDPWASTGKDYLDAHLGRGKYRRRAD